MKKKVLLFIVLCVSAPFLAVPILGEMALLVISEKVVAPVENYISSYSCRSKALAYIESQDADNPNYCDLPLYSCNEVELKNPETGVTEPHLHIIQSNWERMIESECNYWPGCSSYYVKLDDTGKIINKDETCET